MSDSSCELAEAENQNETTGTKRNKTFEDHTFKSMKSSDKFRTNHKRAKSRDMPIVSDQIKYARSTFVAKKGMEFNKNSDIKKMIDFAQNLTQAQK